jgi:large subunit ribosomal protein L18e
VISKTAISKRTVKKKYPYIVETIIQAKKGNHLNLAKKISSPSSNHTAINLTKLDTIKEDTIIVVGKVLGEGTMKHKKNIAALSFSASAKEKLKKAGCTTQSLTDFLQKNKDIEGVAVL